MGMGSANSERTSEKALSRVAFVGSQPKWFNSPRRRDFSLSARSCRRSKLTSPTERIWMELVITNSMPAACRPPPAPRGLRIGKVQHHFGPRLRNVSPAVAGSRRRLVQGKACVVCSCWIPRSDHHQKEPVLFFVKRRD
ncbi:hypothetical protein D9M72_551680 [compost metagenome]